ncbi:2,3-bisphosphoglycerate-dependent phosphoglycerate mutase [Onishia taeanensis]|uniref:2,3-bisphosphoglycerate-dependent phosphoglycerate mutase n=1 Tax=Onishia taeanensis TaxID=284577 RepID=A0A1G7QPA6_9GAMM|nr:histidine phosphatase family protein [Halomonas taeanensis]SDG00377.1 2,3-bisphosphoglycerate-dependent phosphoglycerate mutase [Halomonas taeanensis]
MTHPQSSHRQPRLLAALVRHGDYHQLADTPSAHQPFPLRSVGREQATRAGCELRDMIGTLGCELATQIDSSNLLRAWQTASLMQSVLEEGRHGVAVEGFDDLAERGLGSAANLSAAQIEAIIAEDPRFPCLPANWKSDSHFRLPLQGAESLMEAGERVASHLTAQMQALARHSEADVLKVFVGHGAAFRHAAYRLGVLAFDEIAQLSMHHARPVVLEYHQVEGWRHIAGAWKVRRPHAQFRD